MASFTGSKSVDNVQSRLSGNIAATGGTYIRSVNMPLSQNKGLSESHIPRRFVFSAGYELPWGPGKPFLNQGPAAKILGGWSLQSLLVLQDGYWFTVALPGDRLNTGSSWSQRPDLIGDPNFPTNEASAHPPAGSIRTRSRLPVGFQYGNAGRGIIESPGIRTWTSRFTAISRSRNAISCSSGPRCNAINHTNLGAPGQQFGTSSFGVIGSGSSCAHDAARSQVRFLRVSILGCLRIGGARHHNGNEREHWRRVRRCFRGFISQPLKPCASHVILRHRLPQLMWAL